MKNWHWIVLVIVVYLIGAYWSTPGKALFAKVGLPSGN